MDTIKIAITDDHPLVISGLQNILTLYPHIDLIAAYTNGETLMKGLEKKLPDVLILDIQLPDISADDLVPIVVKKYPDLKILILTNFDSTLYANNMFTRGVKGYILKAARNELLIEAIETVFGEAEYIEPSMKERINNISLRINKKANSKLSLTIREKEILQLIVEGASNPKIAEKLFLSVKTVDRYRTNIMLKLDVNNTAGLVAKALRTGILD